MQSLSWYARRLSRMSPGEVLWRLRSEARDALDRLRIPLRLYPAAAGSAAYSGQREITPPFRTTDLPPGAWRDAAPGSREAQWRDRLVTRAQRLLEHRFNFFDLEDEPFGATIDWHKDYSAGRRAPLAWAPSIDYRDFEAVGDCKLVWELNRHHHLVVLARAYRATGEVRFAREVVAQLESWLDQNPFSYGMNWRSPLELAVRLINWVWAVDLILESGTIEGRFRARLLDAIHLHVWEISRKYSQGSSANNHLIGEAAGVFVATQYFCELPDAKRRAAAAMQILEREILRQSYADGCTREHAFGYQVFVAQFFILCVLVAHQRGVDPSPDFWKRLDRMIGFLDHLLEGGEALPMIGDADDGYVLDTEDRPLDAALLIEIGAALFGRGHAAVESFHWLPGLADRAADTGSRRASRTLSSRAFAESGYYLLQSGDDTEPAISLLVDVAELGLGPIAAHGHADALGFVLRIGGRDVLVDPGTYDYFTYPEWRSHFRRTRAHNTVEVDGVDQSVSLGPFMWGRRARSRCIEWHADARRTRLIAEHDGYRRLTDPVLHRRSLELDVARRRIEIVDELRCSADHEIAIFFHLAKTARLEAVEGHRCRLRAGPHRMSLDLDPALEVDTLRGATDPFGGWVSRAYHVLAQSTTISARGPAHRLCSFRTVITLA